MSLPKIKFTAVDSSFYNWLYENCRVEFPGRYFLAEFNNLHLAQSADKKAFRDLPIDRMRQIVDTLHNPRLLLPDHDIRSTEADAIMKRQVDGLLIFAARTKDTAIKHAVLNSVLGRCASVKHSSQIVPDRQLEAVWSHQINVLRKQYEALGEAGEHGVNVTEGCLKRSVRTALADRGGSKNWQRAHTPRREAIQQRRAKYERVPF